MTVDLRDLELLAATAEFGTLSAAAERLHVTQPALSQRLARLEDRLGTPLFDRVGRRLVPTAAGRRMLVAAHHVLRELGSARQDLRELREARERRVRFAAQHGSPCHWLPPVIRAFRGRHPDAEVRIETLPDDAPVPALLADRVDVALVGDPDTGDGRISLTRLFADELVAVVPGSHPWAALPHLRAEDFGTAHLLLPDLYDRSRIPPVPLPLPRAARPARITTMPVTTDLVIEMVAAGQGVTVLPDRVATPYTRTRDLTRVRIGPTPLTRTWYCATRRGPRPPRTDAFVEELTTCLRR